jgi:hypothetical protein
MRRLLAAAIIALLSLPVRTAPGDSHGSRFIIGAAQHVATTAVAGDAKKEETVSFNTKSYKYHCTTCSAAKRCTRNCIDIPLSDAKARGGVACKICGGSCR